MTWTWQPIGNGGDRTLTFDNFAIVDDTGAEIAEIEEETPMAVEWDAIADSDENPGVRIATVEYDNGQMADELIALRPGSSSRESIGYEFNDGIENEQTYTITMNGDAIGDLTVLPKTATIIDDFESGSLDSGWAIDTAAYTVQSTTVYSGSYALEGDSTSDYSTLASTSGLDSGNYPSPPVEIRCWVRVGDLTDHEPVIGFGTQTEDPQAPWNKAGYTLFLREASNGGLQFRIGDGTDGSTTTLANETDPTNPSNQWVELVAQWEDDGTLTGWYEDVDGNVISEQIQTTDTTYTSGGVLLGINQYNTAGFDYFDEFRYFNL